MPIPRLKTRSYGYLTGRDLSRLPPTSDRGNDQRNKKKRKIFSKKNILLSIFVLGVVGFVSMTILVAWASKDLPDPNRLTDREIAQSTKIYDRTGEQLLYEIFADEKRTLIQLEDIPKNLINGVISIEDKTFYQHKGIRPLSIIKVVIQGALSSGRTRGASTLTQQLVKNAILTNDRSVMRKVKEWILSIRLEQKYSKEQILQIYFNEIPYGSTNYGVQSAAQSYFGKNVQDLTLAESAALAGLPQLPTRYLNNLEAFKNRRNLVLEEMYRDGHISEEEKNSAQAEELVIKPITYNIQAPHFVLYVKQLLVDKYGEALTERGGLKVITTLDWDKQQIAEKVISGEEGVKTLADAGANNASLVAIDPKTGQVLAMVGSRDFYDEEIDGQFNVATLGKRQPGSSFKPIIYTAAFEKGYTPDTILYDVLTNFNPGGIKPYIPTNYTLKEYGPLTMRQALAGSLNIPAVKTLYLIGGAKSGIDFAKRLGYTTLDTTEDCGLALVLGCGGVTVLEHTNAYATLANNGTRHETVSILRVEDTTGKVLEEWKKEKGSQVLAPEVAHTINNVLSDDSARAYIFGSGGILTLPGRQVAAKTGTTNNYIDAWTIGYTPSLAVSVWTGNTNNTSMKSGSSGSMLAAQLWSRFMREAVKSMPVESFPPSPPNTADKPVLKGSTEGSVKVLVNKVTGKLVSSSTPENLIEERTYLQPHEILHYLDKNNPRGPAPENPQQDPQYESWEKGIQEWIERKRIEDPTWNPNFGEPPTEYDDAYSLELIPTLEVIFPKAGSVLTSRNIETNINVSAPRGVSKVTYRLNGVYVGVQRTHPFNLSYIADTLNKGEHTLTIIVEDDIGNRIEENIPFILNVSTEAPSVSFGSRSYTIPQTGFPTEITLSYQKIEDIKQLMIYLTASQGGSETIVSGITNLQNSIRNGKLTIPWYETPLKGNYILSAEITTTNGNTVTVDEVPVEVK